jgi:broad specificity phosphatase PhoE
VVRLYLVRHGKAAAAFSEAPDPGLDATGDAQAEAMAERMAPLGPLPIITSPLRRTRETAVPLEKRWRFTARIEPAVGEIPSPMEDPAARGVWLRGVMAGVWSAQAEELRAWRQRVVDALVALPRPTLVVTHFVAINVAVLFAEGDDRVVGFASGAGGGARRPHPAGVPKLHRLLRRAVAECGRIAGGRFVDQIPRRSRCSVRI